MKKPNIIFFGTPKFAVKSLDDINNNFNVLCVVTSQDKKSGRGLKVNQNEIKKFSLKNNLLIRQPEDIRNNNFIEEIRSMNADLFIVVAFKKLPKEIFTLPKLGTINLHASLLPNYRGAAPINWALINNEKVTGVTTFFINEKIDQGDIILYEKVAIKDDDDYGSLYNKLSYTGAKLLLKTISTVYKGDFKSKKQPSVGEIRKAPKLDSKNTRINWEDKIERILGTIRGLSPYPGSWTILRNGDKKIRMKIIKADLHRITSFEKKNIGKVSITDNKILVNTEGGQINCSIVQLENKKEMTSKDLLNGYKFDKNSFVL